MEELHDTNPALPASPDPLAEHEVQRLEALVAALQEELRQPPVPSTTFTPSGYKTPRGAPSSEGTPGYNRLWWRGQFPAHFGFAGAMQDGTSLRQGVMPHKDELMKGDRAVYSGDDFCEWACEQIGQGKSMHW